MNKLPQQPSPEAVEMLAKLMLLKAKRESPELFARPNDKNTDNDSAQVAEQLSLPLLKRVDD